ncbi:MAG: DUF1402 family protein [Bdellovibrio sp.]|nr:DUF1402 family protein [Bdellovibrio sp.]
MKKIKLLLALLLMSFSSVTQAQEIILLPAGNTLTEMPPVPEKSLNRYVADLLNSELAKNPLPFYIQRYEVIKKKLFTNYETKTFSLKREILKAADLYHIDPIHIASAIVGEHVFNVDIKDTAQEYALKLKIWQAYWNNKHPFAEMIDCPEMNICKPIESEYLKWDCYGYQWEKVFRNKNACGKNFPNTGLVTTFFDPTTAGKTYGLGQMGPIKILSLTDVVHRVSGLPKLSINEIDGVYAATLDPAVTIHYIAAAAVNSIEIYKKEAGFDISQNPGLTSTLYNLGNERARAIQLAKLNKANKAAGRPLLTPQVNYYGWFVNYVTDDLRKMLAR